MNQDANFVLMVAAVLNLYIVTTSRIASSIRATALQGIALAVLPIALWESSPDGRLPHVLLMSAGTLVVKALFIPALLFRSLRESNVHREVDASVSSHQSILVAMVLIGISFWLGSVLVLPRAAPATFLVPIAFATLLMGFWVLVSRRKAITQVVGYLMLENGIFIFGQTLVEHVPFAVELGILLDLLVGVFVMVLAIHHISSEFDHIDTHRMSTLSD